MIESLSIDLETKSGTDLSKSGVYRYVEDEDFEILLDFVEEEELDRVGVFKYSREEGTPAGDREDQIPEETKEERFDSLMRRQIEISLKKNQEKIGSLQQVLVEEEQDDGTYLGRTYQDAPEIDNGVLFTSKRKLEPGDFVEVRITDAFDYDIVGIVEER